MSEAPPNSQTPETAASPKPRWKRVVRLFRRVFIGSVLGVVAFLFLIYFLLQIPPVQRYVVRQITETLSSELQTEVSLGAVELKLFDKFALKELAIQDREGRPLLESERTEVNFSALLLNLFRKRLVIQDLTLQHARFNWIHPYGSLEPNLQFVIDYLKNPDTTQIQDPSKKPLDLRIRRFFLEDVEFVKLDSVRGNRLRIYVREGDGVIDRFDLQEGQIDTRQLFLDGLAIDVISFDFDSTTFSQLVPPQVASGPWDPDSPYIGPFYGFPSLCIDVFHVRDGKFSLQNVRKEPERLSAPEVLNYNYLDIYNADIVVRSFSLSDQVFHGNINRMSFEDSSGFKLEQLTVESATVSGQAVELYDMKLITPRSSLGDTLILTYKTFSDFINFPDAVKMDVRLRESSVWIDDIITFAPGLERNPFFQKNRDEVLTIDGQISGKVNSLRGRDLKIRLARNTLIQGNFSSLFLAVPDLASLNLRLDRLETQVSTLRELIPGFNPPPNFDRLGRLVFSGSFDGFFSDFVAYGELRTRIGKATMDMKLFGGDGEPEYSGELALLNFDLKEFTGNANFGHITFTSKVLDGKGFSAATANARLEAKIDSFYFRDYPYRNLAMEGQLNRNLFDGIFGIQDPNIDFSFNGTIDFTQQVPFFDFTANVRRIDTRKLNFSEKDFILSGLIDLKIRDTDLSRIEGDVVLRDFLLLKDHKKSYLLNSMAISAHGSGNAKTLSISSEIADGEVNGRFDLKELSAVFFQFLRRNYAVFSERFGIPETALQPDTSHFHFNMTIKDTQEWMELLAENLGPLKDGEIQGYFSNQNDSLYLELDFPGIQLGETTFEDIYLRADGQRDTCVIDFGVFRTRLASGRELAPVSILGLVNRDTLTFGLTAIDYDRLLNKLEMDGVFYLDEQDYIVRFAESRMVILNNEWEIRKNNFIRFGKDYVQTRNFVLTSGNRRILLQSLDRRGLQLYMLDFNLNELNSVLEYEPMQFSGGINLEASIDDLFELSGLHLVAHADSLLINETDYGALHVSVEAENPKSPFDLFASITRGSQKVKASGFYNPPNYVHDPKYGKKHADKANYLQATAELADFPLAFLEIWIGAGVSDTEGLVSGAATFTGEPGRPEMSGKLNVKKGATTIDFLNTRYFIDDQTVDLTSFMIDATGSIITDNLGNQAVVFGGITHDHLQNLGLNAQIRSDNFLMLNTKKGQNELFYGTAIASGNLLFSGPFAKADIYVNATSKSGTHIVLPISSKREAKEVSYIRFTQRYRKPDSDPLAPSSKEALGVSVEMDLNITDEAIIEMVFDEQAGDILRGKGNGTIQMVVPRTGDFLMYGEYMVTSGDYLFTLMNLVNKPFEVRRGGTIRWSGDPFGAKINIDAEYKDLKATLTSFLAEYLVSEPDQNVKSAARTPTEVDLVMNLSGDLMQPSVGFDIQIPKVPPRLAEYTDSKLRILRQDQNEMNRQAFGLIVLGQFLPSQNALQGQELAIGINTLTEMLSQQLSLYLTGLVSEWLAEDGLISGIDFDIAYNYSQGTDLSGTSSEFYRANELQVRLKNYLFNDRLTVNLGGNIGTNAITGSASSGTTFLAGDLAVEYALTKDQTLKIRFYQSTEPDLIGTGRSNRTGLGLSYRREFDTFEEFLQGLRLTTKKLKGS